MATAILFDAMGTLVALEPPAPRLRRELSARLGAEVDLAGAQRAIAAEIAYYRTHLNEGRDELSLAELRTQCAEQVRAALRETPTVAAAPAAVLRDALLAALRFRRFSDALPALELARAAGVRTVVVSNWDISLVGVLAAQGLMTLIDGVVTSAEVGARKPAPEIFARGLEVAGVSAQDAVHVGDSFEEDVLGARQAGLEPVLLLRDLATPAPDGVRVIRTLTDLYQPHP